MQIKSIAECRSKVLQNAPGQSIAKCRSKVLQNAPREHSAILLTFIKLQFVFKTFVLSIFEWPLKTGFTVLMTCIKLPPVFKTFVLSIFEGRLKIGFTVF